MQHSARRLHAISQTRTQNTSKDGERVLVPLRAAAHLGRRTVTFWRARLRNSVRKCGRVLHFMFRQPLYTICLVHSHKKGLNNTIQCNMIMFCHDLPNATLAPLKNSRAHTTGLFLSQNKVTSMARRLFICYRSTICYVLSCNKKMTNERHSAVARRCQTTCFVSFAIAAYGGLCTI